MEPNQNLNIIPYSLSSSSSGNLGNDSKKSEKPNSKKSILRKEGSQSKNKDKHAVFVEPSLNQVAFYVPDLNNMNKNNRISLNTVSEEPEPNSRSGSELINNRNMSIIRSAVNTEQKLTFENNEINSNNFVNDMNNNNKSFAYFNNRETSFFNNNFNHINNQAFNKDNKEENKIVESKTVIFKNQHIKKPPSRKTLDSDYILKDFSQTNDLNNNSLLAANQQNESNTNNIINNQNISSKVVRIRLSNSGRNSFSSENNLNTSLEQNNSNFGNLSNNNTANIKQNEKDITNNSSNERRERIEEQTKLNTEANRNLFNINAPRNSVVGLNEINKVNDINNNNQTNNNMIDNVSNQINQIITKNNNIKKPKFNKRITIAMTKDDDFDFVNHDFGEDTNQNLNNINNNFNNNQNDINKNDNNNNKDIIFQNKDRKMPNRNKKRITMALNPFDENPNLLNDELEMEQKPPEIVSIQNNSKKLYKEKDYTNSYNINEEVVYVEPKIIPQNKNINYSIYEKYLKYNNLNFPKSESKLNNITNLNFPQKDDNDNISGSQTTKKEMQMINNDMILNNLNSLQNFDQNNINIQTLKENIPKNKNFPLNIDSSPLIDLINDKSFLSKNSENTASKQDDKYNLILNEDENFDIEKEINNQINFIEKNLEEKEKYWKNKIINNAERHTEFESEINKNKNELNNIEYRINEIMNLKNDLINNKNKYEKLTEKARKMSNDFISAGIEIKDIEHIMYKQMNCLLFTVMVKNEAVFKFLISDNIWYEKNVSGDSEITFIGVIKSEIFSNYFEEETIINTNKNVNDLIQKYYYETILKVFPNEYEKITIHNLSRKYFLSTQISLCFLHILKIINHISLIDEELEFNTQDLKKYFVKFSYIDIYSAKINFIYELNIENPFSGNCLKSVEVEKNDYILNDFNEYRNNTLNLIWKYFDPKDIQINYNYFYNMVLMLNYIDKVRALKTEINDEYIFNVMQGNIKPKKDEFENEENNNFDMLELSQQLEIIYGKKFLDDLVNKNINEINEEIKNENNNSSDKDIDMKDKNEGNNGNDSKDNDEEIVLDLPSSNNDDDK